MRVLRNTLNIRNLSPLSLLVLTACGGENSTISSLLTSASGKVIKGPLNNALVGLDYDGDGENPIGYATMNYVVEYRTAQNAPSTGI